MDVCPCKGCTIETGRSADCHSKCERYLEWKKQSDDRKETIAFQRSADYCRTPRRWYKTKDGYWRNTLPKTRRKK